MKYSEEIQEFVNYVFLQLVNEFQHAGLSETETLRIENAIITAFKNTKEHFSDNE